MGWVWVIFSLQEMSCQCFAEMLINFRFGKFLALQNVIFLAKVMSKFSVFFDGLTNLILINFIANMSSTGKRFDETEWSQDVE